MRLQIDEVLTNLLVGIEYHFKPYAFVVDVYRNKCHAYSVTKVSNFGNSLMELSYSSKWELTKWNIIFSHKTGGSRRQWYYVIGPGRQYSTWSGADWSLLIGPIGTIFSEILIKMQSFSFKKMHLKIPSANSWLLWPGLYQFKVWIAAWQYNVIRVSSCLILIIVPLFGCLLVRHPFLS